MDKHIPEHPLPDEIRDMARDDTVCKFCGVSYLIHNEIKALEEKLAAAESELVQLRGCEEREQQLSGELNVTLAEQQLLEAQLLDRDSLLEMQKKNLLIAESNLHTVTEECDVLKAKVETDDGIISHLRSAKDKLRHSIATLVSQLAADKKNLTDTRTLVVQLQQQSSLELAQLSSSLSKAVLVESEEYANAVKHLEELNNDCTELKQTNKKLQQTIQAQLDELNDSNQLSAQFREALQARDDALSKSKELTVKNNSLDVKVRTLTSEAEQFNKQLRFRTQEYESLSQKCQLNQQTYENQMTSLQRELTQTKNYLLTCQNDLHDLREQENWNKKNQAERERTDAQSQDEMQSIKNQLSRVLSDHDAMKLEREQMIAAHHNRIEDLRESFKRKMNEADKWPLKLEKALKEEREKQAANQLEFQQAMKENFVMEMEIEKQKHQELLDRIKTELKSEVTRLKALLKSKHDTESEIESLRHQLKTSHAEAQGVESRLRSEIQNLKSIIADLEKRLGNLDTGDKELTMKLKSDISDKERQLHDSIEKCEKLENQVTQLKDQIQLLQDTVRKECEERLELLDALGEAREELLHLKKPIGGYNQSSRNASPKNPLPPPGGSPNRRSSASEEMMLFKRSGSAASNRTKEPVGVSTKSMSPGKTSDSISSKTGSTREPQSSDRSSTSTNQVHIGFKQENVKGPGNPMQALKAMDSEQKKRLAAIMSRKH